MKSLDKSPTELIKERRDRYIAKLEEKHVPQEMIDAVKKNFNSQLRQASLDEKPQKILIIAIQKVLELKSRSKQLENLEAILLSPEGFALRRLAQEAIENLEISFYQEKLQQNSKYKQHLKNTDKLKQNLSQIKKLYKDPNSLGLFPFWKPNPFLTSVDDLLIKIDEEHRRLTHRGRPSNKKFYDYVYTMAKLYERISGKKFTVLRHKTMTRNKTMEYEAITEGHRFIIVAVNWLHEFKDKSLKAHKFQYTDKNIYNACEKAQKRMKE